MRRLLVFATAIAALAGPAMATAAAPRSPKGAWSGRVGTTGDMGFRVAGKYKLDGRKTGLYVKDLYVGTEISCERKDELGTSEEITDHFAFPASNRTPLIFNKKSGFFELAINKATAVRGHQGSAPFGNANYGTGKLLLILVIGKGGRSGASSVKFSAAGGAPPLGTLVGTETRGPCKTDSLRSNIAKGSYF